MDLIKIAESMNANFKNKEEMQRAMDIAKAINPDNELSLDDLDSVNGGYNPVTGELTDIEKTGYGLLIAAYITSHKGEPFVPAAAKEEIERKLRENGGNVTPALDRFLEESLDTLYRSKMNDPTFDLF